VPVQKSEGENVPFWTLNLDECLVFEADIMVVMRERSHTTLGYGIYEANWTPTMAFGFPGSMAASPIIMIPHG
jgi:hypothetical protein